MLAFLLAVPLVVAAVPTQPGDLIITEIMAYPNEVPIYTGEWFEVHNPTDAAMDLSGLRVLGHSGKDSGFIIDELVIVPGGYAVFGVSDCSNASACEGNQYNGGYEPDYVYSRDRMDLDESGDTISLVATVDGALTYVDTVYWDATDWIIQQDYALQLSPSMVGLAWANGLPINWCSAQSSYGERSLYGTPGAANEVCTDDTTDRDGDGYSRAEGDCDEDEPYIHPGAVDGLAHYEGTGDYEAGEGCCGQPYDDADCNGLLDDGVLDGDGDGFSPVAGDCDNENADINPYAEEDPTDGIDNNCNGCIDDELPCTPEDSDDRDGDGYTVEDGDCDDLRAETSPAAAEVSYDGIDNDCDGEDLTDVDGDGLDGALAGGEDCDDEDAAVGAAGLWYFDGDGDGYGDQEVAFTACEPPPGFVADTTDCDDSLAEVHPDADEVTCDGIDNDCDGLAVEGGECELPTGVQPAGCQAVPVGAAGGGLLGLLSLVGMLWRRRVRS